MVGRLHKTIYRLAKYATSLENLIMADNVYTLTQTLSKWYKSKLDLHSAEKYLLQLIEIDPYDSVGYCEMAVLLFELHRYDEAESFFLKAIHKGPPGVAMNTYFRAKCLEKMYLYADYIAAIKKTIRLDHEAISPLLDLFYYYKSCKDKKARKIAKKILSTPILCDQLENDELADLKKYLPY